jgi:hypothetical protein
MSCLIFHLSPAMLALAPRPVMRADGSRLPVADASVDAVLITRPRPDTHTGDMRIAIRVRPGSARPGVGGQYDGALIVRVSARAVDGKATEAALAAVAVSFGVHRGAVRLVAGASSRTKIVDVDAGDSRIFAALLDAPGR